MIFHVSIIPQNELKNRIFTLIFEILDTYKTVNVRDKNCINTVLALPWILLFSVQWKGLPSTTGTAVE